MYQLGGEDALAIATSFPSPPLNGNVLPLDVAKLTQTLPECVMKFRANGKGRVR
jgi:hypothetical protein